MRYTYIPLLMALALLGLAPTANAQGPANGNCTLGTAQADLGANNALGRVFNNGSLFYGNGSAAFYFVPQSAQKSPVYASGLWIGGKVGGNLRVAGGTYGAPSLDFTFWPGPLDNASGRPVNPASCASFDRIYQATQTEIAAATRGTVTADIAAWPVELGAPYFVDLDGDGVRGRDLLEDGTPREPSIIRSPTDPNYGVNGRKINLAGGELPDIIGTQGIWWVMNDVGNVHPKQATPPLGVEVQVLAFSFSRADALGNTTFYKYRIINKSGTDITDAYVSIFSDPDLGDGGDDNVGSDIAAGLGYVYNFDNADGTGGGASYGTPPPAIGYDFFQGPIVADGPDDGSDPDTLGTSGFSYFSNTGGAGASDPTNGIELYNYQQGKWGDGSTMRAFGTGYQQTQGDPTTFAFPGDPVTNQAWSAVNPGAGQAAIPGDDRRFAIHTGPFVLRNGDEQDIVFGIVFAQGQDNLDSITALRTADKIAQAAFDIGFDIPPPPPPPPLCVEGDATLTPGSGRCLEAVTVAGQTTLVWGYPSTSPNYLGRFEVFNGFLRALDVDDKTYNFEGFNVYRYTSSAFDASTRQLIATYDVINGIQEVRDLAPDPTVNGEVREYISARGKDTGVKYTQSLSGLTNYTDYFYGITAYAYNEFSTPRANESSATLITVRPTNITNGALPQSAIGQAIVGVATTQRGGGAISARVVDPTAVTGDSYAVQFFTNPDGTTNYNIRNTTKNTLVLDGAAFYATNGVSPTQAADIVVAEGLSFSVTGPVGAPLVAPGANPAFVEILGPGGIGSCTTGSGSTGGCPLGNFIYGSFNRVPANGPGRYVLGHGGAEGPETSIGRFAPNEFEIRFTPTGSFAYHGFSTGRISRVPFEVWDVGLIVPGQANDPSDDVQMIPVINTTAGTTQAQECTFDFGDNAGQFTAAQVGASAASLGGLPGADWIYAYYSTSTYAAWAAAAQATNPASCPVDPVTADAGELVDFARGRPLQRVIFQANGTGTTSISQLQGTVARFYTTDPNLAGDTFVINTDSLQLSTPTADDRETALDRIAAVPNPYFGTSAYESGNLSSVIRFTNLPPEPASIRIFTVSGSLVTTLNKTSSQRSLDWNLLTSNNLPVASGMYLVHVDIDGVGERTLKLAVINRRTQVTIF